MPKQHNGQAKRIPSASLQKHMKNVHEARSQAEILIEDARKQACEIVQSAEERSSQQLKKLNEISNKELRAFIDEDSLKRHAFVFVKLLSTVNAIRKSHDELLPWLTDLVNVSVKRVIGEFDSLEIVSRVVNQGIRELQFQKDISLYVNPQMLGDMRAAQEQYQELMVGISEINTDSSLEPGTIRLDCVIGQVTLSVDAQLEHIIETIKKSVGKMGESKVQE